MLSSQGRAVADYRLLPTARGGVFIRRADLRHYGTACLIRVNQATELERLSPLVSIHPPASLFGQLFSLLVCTESDGW